MASRLDSIVTGIGLIRTRLLDLLRRQGVEEIPAAGEAFDPHVHEGVLQVPAAGLPDGTVAQVFERGYRIGDRVLRPAKVAVARELEA
jgi:molecular chaperone GrpE